MNEIELFNNVYRAKKFENDPKRNAMNRLRRMKILSLTLLNKEYATNDWELNDALGIDTETCCNFTFNEHCERCICGHSIHSIFIFRAKNNHNIKVSIGDTCYYSILKDMEIPPEVIKTLVSKEKASLKKCKICDSRKKMLDKFCGGKKCIRYICNICNKKHKIGDTCKKQCLKCLSYHTKKRCVKIDESFFNQNQNVQFDYFYNYINDFYNYINKYTCNICSESHLIGEECNKYECNLCYELHLIGKYCDNTFQCDFCHQCKENNKNHTVCDDCLSKYHKCYCDECDEIIVKKKYTRNYCYSCFGTTRIECEDCTSLTDRFFGKKCFNCKRK